jgi:ProP effector
VSKARQRERREVIALLAARFPKCFSIQAPRVPLKIGIHAEILAALNGAIKPDQLQQALAKYTSVHGYLHSIVAGASRYDIYGSLAGVVTHEEAAYAKAKKARKHQHGIVTTMETIFVPAMSASRPPSSASPPTRAKRLSLGDLRTAGRRRRSPA